jgi:hypothetical protein
MPIVAALQRLASAACVFFGPHGAVAAHARVRQTSRQAVYRQADDALAAVAGVDTQQQLQNLRQQVDDLQQRLDHCQQQLQQRQRTTAVLDLDKQAEFASTAQAEGVSLPVTWRRLRLLLAEDTPSVAALGRLTQQAGQRAQALLAVLDAHSHPLVRHAAADEIFTGKKPVLMVVEHDSLCWLSGRLAVQRDGAAWAKELGQLPALVQLTTDAGAGLEKGLRLINHDRRKHSKQEPVVGQQLDHFHTLREGTVALGRARGRAARALACAERAEKRDLQRSHCGQGKMSGSGSACRQWQQAEQVFDAWVDQEAAWRRIKESLTLFSPQGVLNTRARAERAVAEALAVLQGAEWSKARRLVQQPETFTFLDRVHRELASLPVPAPVREAIVRREGVQRQPELTRGPGPQAALMRGLVLVWGVVIAAAGAEAQRAVQAVRAILRRAWRASSVVEGLNSVLRMQQGRHRRLTQGLLDLKRLYWNCRPLRTGRRKKETPYGRLGLRLPPLTWWQLLKLTPEQLRQHLSAQQVAA